MKGINKKYLLGGLFLGAILYAYTKECPKNCVKTGIGSCKCERGPAYA